MEKLFISLTSRFLRLNRILLFLLIVFPISIRFYSSANDDFTLLNRIFQSIGGICLLCWLFAIGHNANEKLVLQGIILKLFRFYNWIFILVTTSFILFLFNTANVNTTINGMNVHYATPISLPIIFLVTFIMTVLVSAKTLVSAELTKKANFSEYFTTALLMMFAAIGLWFIQPRVQKL